MTARKKLRAIMAGKKLVLMPGAYDALSARVIEAEGFEAIVAGGYAGVGSHAGAGRHGPVQHARLCGPLRPHLRRGRDSGLCRCRHRLRRRQQRAADGARVRGGRCRRAVHQRPGVSEPLRLSARQADRAGRADAGQGQGRARRAARSRPVHRRAHRCLQRRGPGDGDRALPAFHGGRRRHGEADGLRHHPGDQAGDARNPGAAHGDAVAGGGARRRAACPSWKPPASAPRRSRRSRCSRRRTRCATCCALLKRSDSLAPCQEHLISLDDYYDLVGLKDLLAREESYDKAAAALVQKRAAE